jgi:DnaJ family protein B protein 12
MEVNKEQAEKCKTIGATALKSAQYDRAVKFFKKSIHLYPLPGVEALLTTAERMAKGESSSHSNGGSNSNHSSTNGASSSADNNSSYHAGGASSSSSTRRPTPSPASAPAPSTTRSAPASGGRGFTPEMEETVDRILKAKEGGRGAHYRVLGIDPKATEKDIKKAYRKTAIKVHPDKNSAPNSDEAFKAVGLAYATLSDPQKRTIYDRYGEEDPDNRGGGMGGMRRGPGGMQFRPGQEVNPEDIFNMFFGGGMGGGMGGGGMHRGPGGVHFSTNFGGMPRGFRQQQQRRGQQQHQQQQQEPEAPGLAGLIQLLPFLIIMLLSFFNMNSDMSASTSTGGSNNSPGLNRYFTLSVSTVLSFIFCRAMP